METEKKSILTRLKEKEKKIQSLETSKLDLEEEKLMLIEENKEKL